MDLPADRTAMTKFRYACDLPPRPSRIWFPDQGDAVGLLSPASATWRRGPDVSICAVCWLRCRRCGREADVDAAEHIRRAAERLSRRGLLLVLSDFYDDEERTFAELRRASRMGHEVVLFQILSREEIELPYRRDLEFADLETGRTLALNAGLGATRLHGCDGRVPRGLAHSGGARGLSLLARGH